MRNFFLIAVALLTLIVSTITVSQHVLAASPEETCAAQYPDPNSNDYLNCIITATDQNYNADDSASTIRNDIAASKTPADKVIKDDPGPITTILKTVMVSIASIFAFLAGIAMIALNYAVSYTVVNMGAYVKELNAITLTWQIFRDVGNILLIFGFLFIGISTIIGNDLYGFKTRMLPTLLIVAVTLNFSLFAAEAVIDTGNMFATQFYKQINGGTLPAGRALNDEGISGKIMQQLGLASIYNINDNDAGRKALNDAPVFIGFMSIILFIVLTFVLFSIALIFIVRFVYLIFLIILSPIGVAGFAFPKLESKAKWWWGKLFEQTITAPALLLLLYVALQVIIDDKFLKFGDTPNWTGLTGGTIYIGSYASALLSFLIAMGLLIFVVVAAKNMSAAGAGWATKTAGKVAFGLPAFAGRYTVGMGANWAAKRLRSTRIARIPLVGTGTVKGLEKLSGSSFDVRGAKVLGGLKAAGINAGDAHKGGYKDDLKKSVESRTKYAADLKGKELSKEDKAEADAELAVMQNALADLEKQRVKAAKEGKAEVYRNLSDAIKQQQEDIDKFEMGQMEGVRKGAPTDRGAKLLYAEKLSKLPLGFKYLSSNSEAAKKIKEEAKKSKDDKDLDTLRKALKKAGGDDEDKEEKPKEEPKPEAPKKEPGS